MKKKNKKGFTVVELIAVIVLLAIVLLIAVASMSSINEKTKEKQRENKLNAIKVAASNYLNDTGTYKVYVDTLVNQGYLEYDELEGMKKLVTDPLDENKNLNCYYAEMNINTNEVKLIPDESEECKEEIQINTDVGIKYCIDNDGTCEPDKDDFAGWKSTGGKTKVVLGGSFSNENISDGNYNWTTPSAPDLGQTTERYIIDLPDGTYVNEMYRLTVAKGGKNYNGSAIVKIDNARPTVSNLEIKCADGTTGDTCIEKWSNDKTITAKIDDRGSGIKSYKVSTDSNCTSGNWNVFDKALKTYDIVYKVNETILEGNSKTYYFCVKDEAGNTNIIDQNSQMTVKRVDVIKPKCNYTGESTIWTNNNRSITWGCKDDESGCTREVIGSKTYDYSLKTYNISNFTIRDNAGNTEICSKTADVYVDKTAPTGSMTISRRSGYSYNSRYATITMTGNDSHSGVVSLCYSTSSSSNYTCTNLDSRSSVSNSFSYDFGSAADGSGNTYRFYYYIKDSVGNTSAVSSASYTLYKLCSSTYVSSYGTWGSCSNKCGSGSKYRTEYRKDSYLGGSCSSTTGSTSCTTTTHTSYGSWGSCSNKCGSGTKSRSYTVYSDYDNSYCSSGTDSTSCYTSTTTSYGSWSSCPKCGTDAKRSRTVTVKSSADNSTCSTSTQTESCGAPDCCSETTIRCDGSYGTDNPATCKTSRSLGTAITSGNRWGWKKRKCTYVSKLDSKVKCGTVNRACPCDPSVESKSDDFDNWSSAEKNACNGYGVYCKNNSCLAIK